MAVFQDPSGAFISACRRPGCAASRPRARTRSARLEASTPAASIKVVAVLLSRSSAGRPKTSGTPEQPYTEFQVDGQSIGGATEMSPMVPAEVAELLAGVLHGERRRRIAPDGARVGRSRARRADGLPGRPDVDPERPSGRGLRPHDHHRLKHQALAWAIASARCSASMIVIRCGNPDGASGMIDASTTNNRSTPWIRPPTSTTSPRSGDGPIAQVPTTCGIE